MNALINFYIFQIETTECNFILALGMQNRKGRKCKGKAGKKKGKKKKKKNE